MANKDIVDLLIDDHNEFRQLFERLERIPANERGELFNTVMTELARHEAAEEAIVHPTLRDEVEGGAPIAESVLEEENEAEHLMARMEDMDPQTAEFLDAFQRLRDDVLEHADHEEREEFPRLRGSLSEERLQSMAEGFQRVKDVAPTHPHPHTPQTPEVRAAVGPVAGAFDRARDAVKQAIGG